MKKIYLIAFLSFIFLSCDLFVSDVSGFLEDGCNTPSDSGSGVEALTFTQKADNTFSVSGSSKCFGKIDIPDNHNSQPVSEISQEAFLNNKNITEITIPSSVKTVGNDAFSGCSNLEKVSFENGLQSLGSNAFSNCTTLNSVYLGNTLTSIGNDAFNTCGTLEKIIIPETVGTMGSDVFMGCSNLTICTSGFPSTSWDSSWSSGRSIIPNNEWDKISFDTMGCDPLDPFPLVKSENLSDLPSPSCDTKTFDGWYFEKNYLTKVDSRDSIKDDVTLFAKWK